MSLGSLTKWHGLNYRTRFDQYLPAIIRVRCIPSMLRNAVSKNRDHTRQKFYQPCCNSFINHVQPKQTQNAIFHALSFIPSYLFSSRSVSPDTQHTHCEANTTDTAPHELNPLLLSCAPLDLFAIDVVYVLIHNALLQALLHGQV